MLCNLTMEFQVSQSAASVGRKENERVKTLQSLLQSDVGMVTVGLESLVTEIDKASMRKDSILIVGETGTGKEQVARAIECLKSRYLKREANLYEMSCAELPHDLMESELFGHERGSFTGALSNRKGLIEHADGCRLFLDEVGELSAEMQAKLLRVIEDRKVRRVGSNEYRDVDVQIIAATSSAKAREDGTGTLRRDLYHRLASTVISLPSFRDRPDKHKHALLSHAFQEAPLQSERSSEKTVYVDVHASVSEALSQLFYSGNVRQVLNVVKSVYANAEYEYADRSLPDTVRVLQRHVDDRIVRSANVVPSSPAPSDNNVSKEVDAHLTEATKKFQISYIKKAIFQCQGNMTHAARLLGLDRTNLYRKMGQLGMDKET